MRDLYFTCRSSKRPGSTAFACITRLEDGALETLTGIIPVPAIRVVAVLNAAQAALEAQQDRSTPIILHTDSKLVVDVLTGELADALSTRDGAPSDYSLPAVEAATALFDLAQDFADIGIVLEDSTHPLIQALSDEATARTEADCAERIAALGFNGWPYSPTAERYRRRRCTREARAEAA